MGIKPIRSNTYAAPVGSRQSPAAIMAYSGHFRFDPQMDTKEKSMAATFFLALLFAS
jgi:hypothetical protein